MFTINKRSFSSLDDAIAHAVLLIKKDKDIRILLMCFGKVVRILDAYSPEVADLPPAPPAKQFVL